MTTLTPEQASALSASPLGRTVAEHATDIWNDSCAIDELAYAVAFGAVGATANPTIAANFRFNIHFLPMFAEPAARTVARELKPGTGNGKQDHLFRAKSDVQSRHQNAQ